MNRLSSLFRRCLPAASVLCLLLLALLCGAAAAEERHTVVLNLGGSGRVGVDRLSRVSQITLDLSPENASDGGSWNMETLQALPGFQLQGAALRFYASSVQGIDMTYTLMCGGRISYPQRVQTGWNMWDVTVPVSAWLETPENGLRLVPAYASGTWAVRITEGSLSLQLTFTADASLADFPQDRIRFSPVYEYSLSMLEEDSPFIARYAEMADSLLSVTLPLGVPYYYAGGSEEKFLSRYFPSTESAYYHEEHMYLCGLDCVGMTRLVYEKCGFVRHPSISDILRYGVGTHTLRENDPSRWFMFLRPGDLVCVRHGTFHVMMYLGTLRQFGWTGKDAGEAVSLLDAPLVIHCGGSPFYYDRYQEYIAQMGYNNTLPPDGGVTVSVIQPSLDGAPHTRDVPWGKHFGWYLVDGSPLLVFPLEDCTDLAWYGPEK